MSYTDNATILQKADLAISDLTSGGGLLKSEAVFIFGMFGRNNSLR